MTLQNELPVLDLSEDTWAAGVPHAQFHHLRRGPVTWHPETDGPGYWVVTRYEDLRTVTRDPSTYSSELGGTLIPDLPEEALAQQRMSLLNMDPPQHARYRKIVARAFAPKVVAMLEKEIAQRAATAIDDICERGSCEYVDEVAARVPIQTICQMIGLEPDEWPRMLELSKALVSGTDDAAIAAMEIFGRCDEVATQRRSHPRDDLMSALIAAEVDGDRLDAMELCMFFITLVVAGNESTRYLIANSVSALMENPAAATALRENPGLWDTATEELLRWGASVTAFRRTATRPTVLSGVSIAAGDKVVVYYLSANRDETVFDDPYRFDITRTENPHVTFGGGGIHHCLGVSLARAQVRATVRETIERVPDLRPDGAPVRLRSSLMNGFESMPLRFTPSRRMAAGT